MNRRLLTLLTALLTLATGVMAQAPQELNYQAVVRNASGQPLVAGTNVTARFQIHDGSPQGPVVFQETTTLTTNQFGLVNFQVGSIGNLQTVDWASGAKYLQVEIDPAGGTDFTDMGTSQLISVPYALFAANSANGPPGSTGPTGPAGNSGDVGATGPQGPAGPQGSVGGQGANGVAGPAGPIGPQGANGVAGPAGPTGVQGAAGPAGSQGPAGPAGAQGSAGPAGPAGVQGAAGPSGVAGAQGAQGVAGAQGPAGPAGAQGPAGVGGAQGVQGVTGLQGPQGIQGNTGSQGPIGTDGSQGLAGPTGPQGPTGADGATGPSGGPVGPTGAQGDVGPTGPQGDVGAAGTQGPQGATGNDGAVGATGAQGATGNDGAVGATGPSGQDGAQGPTGNDGVAGPAGNDGAVGATGPTGNDGAQGPTGPSGNDGAVGATGPSGNDGMEGPTGAQGPTGVTTDSIWVLNGNYIYQATLGDSVGIGTSAPVSALEVNGVLTVDNNVQVNGGAINGPGIGNNFTISQGNGNGASVFMDLAGDLVLSSYNTGNAVRLSNSNGNTQLAAYWDNTVTIGDVNDAANGTVVAINDVSQQISLSSNTGVEVGINNAAPSVPLDVIGTTRINDGTAQPGYVLTSTDVNGTANWQPIAGGIGATGPTGPSGNDGAAGATGPSGNDGAAGATGVTGFLQDGVLAGNTPYWDGSVWQTGSSNIFNDGGNVGIGTSAPQQQLEVNGSAVVGGSLGIGTETPAALLDVEGGNAIINDGTAQPGYVLTSVDVNGTTSWQPAAGSVGPTGPTGPSGGPIGPTGPSGNDGAAGPTGPSGNDGAVGPTGPSGAVGATGPVGPTGASGNDGAVGPTGPSGNDGAVGATGPTGPSGGPVGPTGPSGNDGAAGPTGPSGNDGAVGATGPSGNDGATGPSGNDGATGPTGFLQDGGVAGSTPYWDGTEWQTTSTNIFNDGGNVGVGTATPAQLLEVAGTAVVDVQLGVGTTSPGATLDVEGDVTFNDGTAQFGYVLTAYDVYGDAIWSPPATGTVGATGATGPTGFLQDGNAAGNTPYWDGTQWQTGSSNIFNDGGNVGIGTITPAQALEVNGTGIFDGGLGVGTDFPAQLMEVNGTAAIDDSLGVGTQFPAQTLEVNGTAAVDVSLGVGTAFPGATLDVEGTMILNDNSAQPNYVLTSTGTNGSATWMPAAGGVGPTGPTGPSGGPVGPTGPTGNDGVIGPTGPSGNDGAVGATGSQGPTGNDGTAGATGATGPSGNDGVAGATGATGPTGNDGAAGVTGATGPSGNDGQVGATGATGPTGAGVAGPTGATGGTANLNGTTNYVVKFTPNGTTGGNSEIFDNGTQVGIGTATPGAKLEVDSSLIYNDYNAEPGEVLISVDNIGTAHWSGPFAFKAGDAGGTDVPGGAPSSVDFDQVYYDNTGGYDSTTGEFTAPITGLYHFDVTVEWGEGLLAFEFDDVLPPGANGGQYQILLYVNDFLNPYHYEYTYISSFAFQNETMSVDVVLNAGDVVVVGLNQASGDDDGIVPDANASTFSGHLVR